MRRAIVCDEVMQIPQSVWSRYFRRPLAIVVVIFRTYLAVLLPSRHAIPVRIPTGELCGYENRKLVRHSAARWPNYSALTSREMGRRGKYYDVRITHPIPFDIGFLPTYN